MIYTQVCGKVNIRKEMGKKMIDKIEPDWCYEDKKYEVIDCEDDDYDLHYADEYHELMMLGE